MLDPWAFTYLDDNSHTWHEHVLHVLQRLPTTFLGFITSPPGCGHGPPETGDQEPLAIKWGLVEERHWPQGGRESFAVQKDHQNLIAIQQAKQINPR